LLTKQAPDLLKKGGVTIIGSGWQEKILKRRLRRLALDRIVRVRPQVEHVQMKSLYQRHQLVLYIPFDEPFGLVPLEAMAAGRPVIGSEQGGIRETVVHGETGLLVPPCSVEDVARAIKNLLTDPEKCDDYGNAGFQRYREFFTLERFVDTYLSHIDRV